MRRAARRPPRVRRRPLARRSPARRCRHRRDRRPRAPPQVITDRRRSHAHVPTPPLDSVAAPWKHQHLASVGAGRQRGGLQTHDQNRARRTGAGAPPTTPTADRRGQRLICSGRGQAQGGIRTLVDAGRVQLDAAGVAPLAPATPPPATDRERVPARRCARSGPSGRRAALTDSSEAHRRGQADRAPARRRSSDRAGSRRPDRPPRRCVQSPSASQLRVSTPGATSTASARIDERRARAPARKHHAHRPPPRQRSDRRDEA